MSAHAIRRPASRAVSKSDDSSGSKRKWMIAIAVLLLMIGAAWAYLRPSSQLSKVMAMQAEIRELPRDEQRRKWGEMREEVEKLTDAERDALFAPMMEERAKREQKEYDRFFALSKADQIKEIDKEIDREQRRRKEWEQRRASGQARQGGGDRGGRGGGPGGNWGGGRGGSRDSAERRKASLDRSSPQERAQRDEYRRMRDDRRAARGIT
jgi:hypothetical protein